MEVDEASTGPPSIGALMRMPVEAVYRRLLADLHDAGFDDLVRAHFAVFRYPGPDGGRPSDLAAEAGTSKQAMNYLLGQLERLGYLVRVADPKTRRSRRVRLTERGHAAHRRILASLGEIEAGLDEELGADRFGQLRELLLEVNDCATLRDPLPSDGR